MLRNNLVKSPQMQDANVRIQIVNPNTRFVSPPINKKIAAVQKFGLKPQISVYQDNSRRKVNIGSKERYKSRNDSFASSNKSGRNNGSVISETPMRLFRMINDISSTVSSQDDEARKLSLINHKYSMFFNNLNSETQNENTRKLSNISSILSNKMHHAMRSGKLSSILHNKSSIISMNNQSDLINEIFEEESSDSTPRKLSKIILKGKNNMHL